MALTAGHNLIVEVVDGNLILSNTLTHDKIVMKFPRVTINALIDAHIRYIGPLDFNITDRTQTGPSDKVKSTRMPVHYQESMGYLRDSPAGTD